MQHCDPLNPPKVKGSKEYLHHMLTGIHVTRMKIEWYEISYTKANKKTAKKTSVLTGIFI